MASKRVTRALLLALLACATWQLPVQAARRLSQNTAAPAPAPAPLGKRCAAAAAARLLAFKDSFENGAQVFSTWRPGSDCCAWTGISCDAEGQVVALVVMDKGLRGQIPQPAGWVLPDTISDLSIGNNVGSSNVITGPIPPLWKLPTATETLMLSGIPLGGSLSAQWELPQNLKYWLMKESNISGALPNAWSLPKTVASMDWRGNQLTGTIPKEFTELTSLIFWNLDNNRLSGQLPSSFQFDRSAPTTGIGIGGNNFSGLVPSWPDFPSAVVAISPGNEGLCGPLPPAGPQLIGDGAEVESLPPCPGQSDGSGLSAGAIAGIVVGCVAAASLTLVGAALLLRWRRQRAATADAKSEGFSSGAPATDGSSLSPTPMRSTSTTATVPPFNPFAGGPPSPAPASAPSTGPSPGSTQRTLSLSAATSQMQSGSSGSAAPAARTAALAAKLEALEREAPPWLLPPTRLSMQHHGDGKLVLLGAGAYARVYAGYLVPDTKDRSSSGARAGLGQPLEPLLPVAIKVMEAADVDAFLKEAGMLQRLSGCPQVVALHGACVVDQALTVVMELLEGGDLRSALSGDAPPAWDPAGRQIALDITAALVFLHSNAVTHRDLKSKNVLLTQDGRAKVADVGTAAMHSHTYKSAGASNFGGTLAWAAPELLLGAPTTHKADIYSLGVVLWEIATRRVPRRGDVEPPPPSADCPAGLSQLIADCLQLEPTARPTAQQALERLQAL